MPVQLPNLTEIQEAADIIYEAMPPTPQYSWPLLNEALDTEVWIKHENHTPTGAFKVRGGLVYVHQLTQRSPEVKGVISATRGNHGQSIGFAVRRHGLQATIVLPKHNSKEKNAAMRALGVHLIEQKHKVESPVTAQIADGMACRVPDDESLAIILRYVDQVVAVTDDEVSNAMKLYYVATHNLAEGAGAAPLAAAMQMKQQLQGL